MQAVSAGFILSGAIFKAVKISTVSRQDGSGAESGGAGLS